MPERSDNTEDRVYVQRALNREKGGATVLHSKYLRVIRNVLRRFVKDKDQAEDLAQEAFAKAFRNLNKLKDIRSMRSWLVKIAQRVCLLHKRDRKDLEHEVQLSSQPLVEKTAADPDADLPEQRVLAQEMRQFVEQLPDPYRLTLIQRYYDELPLADVAKAQNIQLPLAKYRVRQGLRLLREKLQAAGVNEMDI